MDKSPAIIKVLSEMTGVDLLANPPKCPLCFKPIKFADFRDKLSLKEYHISHLCQECQDGVFGE